MKEAGSKSLKYALLKINGIEEMRSPKSSNQLNFTVQPKKQENSKKNLVLSNFSKTTNLSKNQIDQTNRINSRSESRNQQRSIQNKNINSYNYRTNNLIGKNIPSKINTQTNYISTDSSANYELTSRISNDKINLKTNLNTISPKKKNERQEGSLHLNGKTPKNAKQISKPNLINNYNSQPDTIDIMTLLNNQNNIPITINALNEDIPNYEASKCSFKAINYVRGYAANTNQGIVRNYNEDRVSIILNMVKPATYTKEYWPKCSFFAIYDGHGGSNCADFLRDNLHQYVIKDPNFPDDVEAAIYKGFEAADQDFIKNHALNPSGTEFLDKSGSCAIVVLIVDDKLFIANVGDSRAVMAKYSGSQIVDLTTDHKPNDENEKRRIEAAGGQIYQTQLPTNFSTNQIILGPWRVFPGRLSVSRSFGDVEAKLPKFGGCEKVLISIPEITTMKITEEIDYIVLGCDGIFDQMSNKEIVECVNLVTKEKAQSIHQYCSMSVDLIMKTSLLRKSLDNITCVIIAFENFEKNSLKEPLPVHKKINSFKDLTVSVENTNRGNISSRDHPSITNSKNLIQEKINQKISSLDIEETIVKKNSENLNQNVENTQQNQSKSNTHNVYLKFKQEGEQASMREISKTSGSSNIKNVRIASSSHRMKSFEGKNFNLETRFPNIETKKFLYDGKKIIPDKHENTYAENIKKGKEIQNDIGKDKNNKNSMIETTKARNVKTLSEFFKSQVKNKYKTNSYNFLGKIPVHEPINSIDYDKISSERKLFKKMY